MEIKCHGAGGHVAPIIVQGEDLVVVEREREKACLILCTPQIILRCVFLMIIAEFLFEMLRLWTGSNIE